MLNQREREEIEYLIRYIQRIEQNREIWLENPSHPSDNKHLMYSSVSCSIHTRYFNQTSKCQSVNWKIFAKFMLNNNNKKKNIIIKNNIFVFFFGLQIMKLHKCAYLEFLI